MITRELERILTFHSRYQPGEIDTRTRPLREHNLIPSGPRGVNAPDLEPLHAALVVLTMVSRRAADSGAVVMRAMDLKMVPRAGCNLDKPTTLAVMLAAGISAGSSLLKRMEITCDGEMAWATIIVDDAPVTLLFTDDPKVQEWVQCYPETYDAQGASYCGHRFVINGALIDQIKLEMEDDAPAGYAENHEAIG